MSAPNPLTAALPRLQPEDPGSRLFLFALRQMGANGLADAATSNAYLMAFGRAFERPLVLTRVLLAELSCAAAGPIQIAPWCCPRMTPAEGALLGALARVERNERAAALLLADLLGSREAGTTLATAAAVARAFSDLGLPLGEA